MNDATILLAAPTPGAGANEAAPAAGAGDYEKVEGRDRETIECQRACEAVAADKTASDYSHIVWAYGVIWALFCAYGIFLWRRSQRLADDISALNRKLERVR
ncbi:MAG: hypothetical protein JKY37_24700 [Nannocystaceae bacterium]|nr:hypothetical protein [Nannocystaceae bacterium]